LAIIRVLESIYENLPEPFWVVLADSQGLVLASVPREPDVEPEKLAAMTAALVTTSSRVLQEIRGGSLRYASIAGAHRHHVSIILKNERVLTIGLPAKYSANATFQVLREWIPELLKVIEMRIPGTES
jgi:predicted regulator of Ras-like GTPase activity (Roadblock/LC7/MglB family)